MQSDFKYSWAIKQTNVKKVHAIIKKVRIRKHRIIDNLLLMKANNMAIDDSFIALQKESYLYECYRLNKIIAVYRHLKGYHALVKEDVYNNYKDSFYSEEASAIEDYFYKRTRYINHQNNTSC